MTEPYCFAIPRNVFIYLWVSQGDLSQIEGYFEHWDKNNFYCLMKSAILQGYSVACPITSLHAHLNPNRFWHILYQLIIGERNLWIKIRNYLVVVIWQYFSKEYGSQPLNSLFTSFLMIMYNKQVLPHNKPYYFYCLLKRNCIWSRPPLAGISY